MPAGYRAGVPQQPYTKYESDNEEVKVEYKRVDSSAAAVRRTVAWFSGYKGAILRILLFVVVFLLGLILGYIVRRSVKESMTTASSASSSTDYSSWRAVNGYESYSAEISRDLGHFISIDSIQENLKNYSVSVHITGTSNNNQLRDHMKMQLEQLHLVVKEARYNVLLSYHDWERYNFVGLFDANGSLVYHNEYNGPSLDGDSRSSDHPEITEPYIAYSPNGSAQGDLVYANYGEEKDFKMLASRDISCKNKIVIMRYGRIFEGQMIQNAEACGAEGVLLYPDPSEVLDDDIEIKDVYPNARYLPGWASRRGSLWRFGDPLTPGLPSKDAMRRLSESEADLPHIPVQPISYEDAYKLMSHMLGPIDNEFVGGMRDNVTYRMGPGYYQPQENWKVKLEVFNELETREITNFFGIIKGREEPDRYVILGCHYDAWTYGGVDPNTGLAVLMEVVKAFSKLTAKGWKPRRTIAFAFWDANEMGQVGSFEWVEDHELVIADRTVAYINLDEAVSGNYVLDVEASPMMRSIVANASRLVTLSLSDVRNFISQSGRAGQGDEGRVEGDVELTETLFDSWLRRSPSETESNQPKFNPVSPDSDHAAFLYQLGVPVLWTRLVDEKMSASSFPVRHTTIDSYEYVKRFVDPTFSGHVTLARLVAELVLQLSSTTRLALDVRELAECLEQEFNGLQQEGLLLDFKDPLRYLQQAIRRFGETSAFFYDNFLHQDMNNVLEMRQYNDRLMRVSRAFINVKAYDKPQFRNILFAPSDFNSYAFSTFTGIRDSFGLYAKVTTPAEQREAAALVERQISMATVAVESAYRILMDDEDVFE